jgi:Zn-dependent M28 family amino/carboxypeptidase
MVQTAKLTSFSIASEVPQLRMPIQLLLCFLITASCSQPTFEKQAPPSIDGDAIKKHIQRLASDEMEGRGPAGKGEELATAYIADLYRSIGLKTQLQAVPMVGVTSTVSSMSLAGKGGGRTLKFGDEFMAWSRREEETIPTAADLVFCGYGVTAPEYQWNDFKDDVKGKIIIVLINDPQLDDQSKFGGKAMTYYGRWTYKLEEAERRGAAGALIVHETEYAGYPWDVVRGSWSGEQFDIVRADKGAGTVALQGWIHRDTAAALFKSAGMDFEDMKRRALQPDFRPAPLGIRATVNIQNKMRRVDSKNVVGLLEGAANPGEYVLFTAHWDHLGIGEPQNGDKIYNGAVDNASGVALMMEIARAAAKMSPRPKRSMVFIATAGEEQGTLGSAYYAEHPIFPLSKTLANINIDEANVFGRHNNQIHVIGFGYTDLEDVLREAVSTQGRTVTPDAEPEKGFYFRSDQFSFAKMGVPALYTKSMTAEDDAEFTEKRYHKPSDEFDPNWDMTAAVADGAALLEVALRVANSDKWPEWRPGAEFRAIREESLKR